MKKKDKDKQTENKTSEAIKNNLQVEAKKRIEEGTEFLKHQC